MRNVQILATHDVINNREKANRAFPEKRARMVSIKIEKFRTRCYRFCFINAFMDLQSKYFGDFLLFTTGFLNKLITPQGVFPCLSPKLCASRIVAKGFEEMHGQRSGDRCV